MESGDDSDNSDEEWVNVSHSEDEIDNDEDIDGAENEDEDIDDAEDEEDDDESATDVEDTNETDQSTCTQESLISNKSIPKKVVSKREQIAEKREKAAQVSSMRILTDEDFKRIEIAQLNKQMTSAKRKRTAEPDITSR